MSVVLQNNSYSTLASDILAGDLSLTVATGEGALFPTITTDYFYVTIDDSANVEVVKVTARTGDVFTIVRAQDDTLASGFSANAKVELRLNVLALQEYIGSTVPTVQNAIVKDPTGFDNPSAVTVSYDPTARTVTLAGTFVAYWQGEPVAVLTDGWVSDPHDTALDCIYFLHYNGTAFVWEACAFPLFYYLHIAVVNYGTADKYGIRECHGLMGWLDHKEFHSTIGTYKSAGGTIAGVTLNSATATDRRPTISATTIEDEDLTTVNAALTSSLYTKYYLTGASIGTYVVETAEIVPLNAANPYYNTFSTPNWSQTLMPSNSAATVWVYAIPTDSSVTSQKYRYLFVEPQWVTLAAGPSAGQIAVAVASERLRQESELNLGSLALQATEIVAIGKIIINFTTDWRIQEVILLTGTRISQVGSPSGNFLSTVAVSSGISGNGTPTTPITANLITGLAGGQTVIGGTGASENLLLTSTSNATKGLVALGSVTTGAIWDGVNSRLGIGTATPDSKLEIDSGALKVTGNTVETIISYSDRGIFGTLTNHNLEIRTNNTAAITIDTSQNVGIGTLTPISALDVSSGGLGLTIGANSSSTTRTDATAKNARIGSYHFTNAEEPVTMILAVNASGSNSLFFGGGSSLQNAATELRFFTDASSTATTGTERVSIDSARLKVSNAIFNLGSIDAVIIASGAITLTSSHMKIDTEGEAASDDLDTINGGVDGDVLILRTTTAARDVTIKHATGNIRLAGSADVTLNYAYSTITLIYTVAQWCEVSRSLIT